MVSASMAMGDPKPHFSLNPKEMKSLGFNFTQGNRELKHHNKKSNCNHVMSRIIILLIIIMIAITSMFPEIHRKTGVGV